MTDQDKTEPPVIPMFSEGDDAAHGYMCLTEFQYEIGTKAYPAEVYSSLESAQEHLKCDESCGIVKVEVRALEIVQQPKEQD